MRILTDSRECLSAFAPAGTSWTKRRVPELEESEEWLWRVLTESSVVRTAELRVDAPLTLWRRLIVIGDAAQSQFDVLHEALGRGSMLDGPTAVVALRGHGFRGQHGRPWWTCRGNLFLTAGLCVKASAESLVPGLIMLPAVAVVDAIRVGAGARARPGIKWVNDILINGCKVAGVLTATLCRDSLLEAAVLGVGVNVAQAPTIEPTPFVPAAGCLKDAGIEMTLPGFTWCLLGRLAERYRVLLEEGPAGLLQSYREASCVVGRRVRVWDESTDLLGAKDAWPAPLAAGIVTSVEPDLSLRIDGRESPVVKGRLALEEDCRMLGL